MKKRNGFVSNSSSSSFIIGLAKSELGNEFIPDGDLPYYINQEKVKEGYELTIESFTGAEVTLNIKEGEKFTYLNGVGPDDDSAFWDGDEYDYDIELEVFDQDDQYCYNEIIKNGGDATYGAGRNG